MNLLLKINVGRDRRSNAVILEYFNCWWVSGEVGRWERWKGSEVERWERWEGSVVGRWERWECSEVGKVGIVINHCYKYCKPFALLF